MDALVYDFCTTLHRRQFVDNALFKRAVGTSGEAGVVNLVRVSVACLGQSQGFV